ncbi:MAG: thiamine pyrophosphate-dependent enzyme [Thermodesulfobacteriota bacterium]
MSLAAHPLRKYTRPHVKKTTTCPGCGNGVVAQAILWAIDELNREEGLTMDDFVFVSGIGCSAWIPSPLFAADTLHTTHGRPIAFATGVKLGLPQQKVLVASGDGDLAAIGGNHLIHAARRNIDLTVVMVNNGIYGMTGGQTAPTTPRGLHTITSPYGTMEPEFNVAAMVAAAGAPYVARWTTYHPRQLKRAIKKGIQKQGFAFIEAISQCPVQYGRVSKLGRATAILEHFKNSSVKLAKAKDMSEAELAGKITVGEFCDRQAPELASQWSALRDALGKEQG